MKRNLISALLISIIMISAINGYAAVTDYRAATWNMQGAAGGESKWASTVRSILARTQGSEYVQILSLQEAGGLPQSRCIRIPQGALPPIVRVGPAAAGVAMEGYEWQLGTVSRVNNIYMYRTSVAGRLNLVILSREGVDEIFVFEARRGGTRPVIGIRIGNNYFFNIHAGAHANNEAAAQVNEIQRYMANTVIPVRPNATWMIMGDFNRDPCIGPGALGPQLDQIPGVEFQIINVGTSATQTSGGELDYAVTGRRIPAPPAPPLGAGPPFLSAATLMNQMSDHVGVRFGPPPP